MWKDGQTDRHEANIRFSKSCESAYKHYPVSWKCNSLWHVRSNAVVWMRGKYYLFRVSKFQAFVEDIIIIIIIITDLFIPVLT
jgi:hypothetical protein